MTPPKPISQIGKNLPSPQFHSEAPPRKSYGPLQSTDDDAGEYLPSPSFPSDDYLEVVSNLSPDQIQALPFSIRRKVKSVLSGGASETDIRNVSQNLDNIMHYAMAAEPGSHSGSQVDLKSGAVTPKKSSSMIASSAMAIRNHSNTNRLSPDVSPNTSVFFNDVDSVLSPSSQSILRMQQLYSSRPGSHASHISHSSQSESLASFYIPSSSSNRRLHRAATMYPSVRQKSGVYEKSSISRSASLSSSSNNSPALQFLTRIASNTFSPSATSDAGFGNSAADMGEEIGEYVIGKLIGYGAFSEVKEAHTIGADGEKETLAVKIVHKIGSNIPSRNPEIMITDDAMEQVQSEFDHEVTLWKTLDHPNILKLINVHENSTATYCFTNKISGGTLFDLIKKTKRVGLRPRLAVNYAKQLASALLYLHETMKIVHRDVKPENCLIEEEPQGRSRVVLADFGMSDYYDEEIGDAPMADDDDNESQDNFQFGRKIGPSETSSMLNQYHDASSSPISSTTPSRTASRRNSLMVPGSGPSSTSWTSDQNIGSLPYASPELLNSPVPIFRPSIDIWAFGVLVYSMFRGCLPWQHAFSPRLREMILEGKLDVERFEAYVRERIVACTTQDSGSVDGAARVARQVAVLVQGCLEVDTGKRFTIREIVEHDWGL